MAKPHFQHAFEPGKIKACASHQLGKTQRWRETFGDFTQSVRLSKPVCMGQKQRRSRKRLIGQTVTSAPILLAKSGVLLRAEFQKNELVVTVHRVVSTIPS